MTILPPPAPKPRHVCPATVGGSTSERRYALGTLMECPECGRWWKYREEPQDAKDSWGTRYAWLPVSVWDVKARRRIAAHETEKMYDRVPNIVGDLHWWDCHPNPRRGRP